MNFLLPTMDPPNPAILSSRSVSEDSDSESRPLQTHLLSKLIVQQNASLHRNTSTTIHRLYGRDKVLHTADAPRAEDQDEPSLLWVATVFNANVIDSKYSGIPLAVYQSSSAFQITCRNGQGGIPSATAAKSEHSPDTEKEVRHTWRGRIFEVTLRAIAHFPSREESHEKGKVRTSQYHYDTENFESLVFEKATRSSIQIASPFLYNRLKILGGYYPAFFRQPSQGLTNLNATSAAQFEQRIVIPFPWAFLLHRFPQMEAFVQDSRIFETHLASQGERSVDVIDLERQHIQVLCDFLRPHYENDLLPYLKQLEQPSPSVPFDKLWCVFKPGMDVYIQTNDSIKAMVIVEVQSNLDDDSHPASPITQTELKYWILYLWYLGSDGEKIGREPGSLRLYSYQGLKQLTSLDACPVLVWDAHDGGARRKRLTQRGRLLFKSLQQGHLLANYRGPVDEGAKHYSGSMIVDIRRGFVFTRSEPPRLGGVGDDSCRGDFEEYDNIYVYDGKNAINDSWIDDASTDHDSLISASHRAAVGWVKTRTGHSSEPGLKESDMADLSEKTGRSLRDTLTDHQFLLLCPDTPAFALKMKEWVWIQPDYAMEIEKSDESLTNLVLEESELSTIRALATRQNSKRDIWAADFIEGKGTGQIILLHGPSGVGKTYTVEAIAQYLHRPLLALTVADIGTLEIQVEQELLKWFSLAEAWDAVLLVDEADIFLERRQNRDLARNGLVSAFLRRMEYFKGLLFLTTNRVGQIDDAFISRVHVAIGYQSLSPAHRCEIWKGFFRKLNRERAGKIQIARGAEKWVLEKALSGTSQLNGRDIRNALQTAITLAEAEYEEDPTFNPDTTTIVVDQSHFKRVLEITHKFQAYVESIRREDEKKRAAGRHDRNDYWTAAPNTDATS